MYANDVTLFPLSLSPSFFLHLFISLRLIEIDKEDSVTENALKSMKCDDFFRVNKKLFIIKTTLQTLLKKIFWEEDSLKENGSNKIF